MKFLAIIFAAIFGVANAAIDLEQAILDQHQKIKQLTKKNQDLFGKIEQLEQAQQQNAKKIGELLNLIKYQKNDKAAAKTALKTRETNQAIKKSYDNARNFLASGQSKKAILLLQKFIKKHPNSNHTPDAKYWLAKAYLSEKQYQNAKIAFLKFQKDNTLHYRFPHSLFGLATAHSNLSEHKSGKKQLNIMLKKFPNHPLIFEAKKLLKTISVQSKTATSKKPK